MVGFCIAMGIGITAVLGIVIGTLAAAAQPVRVPARRTFLPQ